MICFLYRPARYATCVSRFPIRHRNKIGTPVVPQENSVLYRALFCLSIKPNFGKMKTL